MQLTLRRRKMHLLILLLLSVMVVGCSNQRQASLTWPQNLNVIELSDGGVCFDEESAKRLVELKAMLEAW